MDRGRVVVVLVLVFVIQEVGGGKDTSVVENDCTPGTCTLLSSPPKKNKNKNIPATMASRRQLQLLLLLLPHLVRRVRVAILRTMVYIILYYTLLYSTQLSIGRFVVIVVVVVSLFLFSAYSIS